MTPMHASQSVATQFSNHPKAERATRTRYPSAISVLTALTMFFVLDLQDTHPQERASSSGSSGQEIVVVDCRVGFLREIEVPALDSGLITELIAEPNSAIKKGSILAKLDRETLILHRRGAELRRTLLSERLDNQIEVEFAETAYEEAKIANAIDEDLYKRNPGAIPMATLRKSRLSLKRAELERERIRKMRREAELELQAHAAEIDKIDESLRKRDITSPSDGVILSVPHAAGEWVSQGETLARIAPMQQLSVVALIDEGILPRRSLPGSTVTVRWKTEDKPQALLGTITSIDPQILEHHKLRIHVVVENQTLNDGWLLYPGRRVELVFDPGNQRVDDDSAETTRLPSEPHGYR